MQLMNFVYTRNRMHNPIIKIVVFVCQPYETLKMQIIVVELCCF
jgi:hypothetical protein